jgi:hypothetical protein
LFYKGMGLPCCECDDVIDWICCEEHDE